MKLFILNGSARSNGNTFSILNKIASIIDKQLLEITIINISDYKINYCSGCHVCEKTSKCVQSDGVDQIYTLLKQADIIGIASPSYWGYITGQLKVFFDRSTQYCNTVSNHEAFPKGKKGIAFAIRAGRQQSENIEIIKAINHFYSHLDITPIAQYTFESIIDSTNIDNSQIQNVANHLSMLCINLSSK